LNVSMLLRRNQIFQVGILVNTSTLRDPRKDNTSSLRYYMPEF